MIKAAARRDWFDWFDPDPVWVRAHAETPGLQYQSNGERITRVTMHRTHLPLVPPALLNQEHTAVPDHHPDTSMLRPYQAEALPFLLSRRAALLTFEMRLGKTVTAVHAHNKRDGMLVVVGPLAARDVWCQWIERVHGFRPIVLQGRTDIDMFPGYPAYFVHYDILDAHTKFFVTQDIGTLILDECHLLQGRKTQRSTAANVLAVRASRIIGLSGTPMWSKPDSLYSLLHLIAPGAWGGHFAFAKQYAGAMPGAHGWRYDSSSNENELRARLSEIVVRRTWRDVLGQLPPIVRVVEPVAVPATKLSRLEMLVMQTVLANGTHNVAGYLATLRRKMAELKVDAAVAAATQAMADQHKPVVWTWHNETSDKLAAALGKAKLPGVDVSGVRVFRIRSVDNQTVRDEQIAQFRACTTPCAMVASIAVGGVAIDLSCSDYAIFAEFDWTPANMYQAEMRTFHPSRPHTVLYLYADIPVERNLVNALQVREGFAAAVGLGSDEITQLVLGACGERLGDAPQSVV